jgi:hypothetical protein
MNLHPFRPHLYPFLAFGPLSPFFRAIGLLSPPSATASLWLLVHAESDAPSVEGFIQRWEVPTRKRCKDLRMFNICHFTMPLAAIHLFARTCGIGPTYSLGRALFVRVDNCRAFTVSATVSLCRFLVSILTSPDPSRLHHHFPRPVQPHSTR